MDKRVLISVAGAVAIVIVAGLVLALGSCGGENGDDVADESVPTQDVADDTEDAEPTAAPEGEDDAETTPSDEGDSDEADEEPSDEDSEESEGEQPDEESAEQPAGDIQLPQGEPERPQSENMAYGFNVAWRGDEAGGEFNQNTRQVVDTAGFNWIRFQVRWSEVQREPEWWDPAPVDRMIDAYEDSGIRIMVSIVGAPEWALDPEGEQFLADWENFVGFMAFMADRYQGRVHAWEIWNEQNMAHEMGGTVRVSDYAHLLEAGYRGVKAADPEALVVFGGLTPTGINDPAVAVDDVQYLQSFYIYGDGYYQQFFDVMGMHLNSTNNPPDSHYPDNPGPGEWSDHNSFYFLRGQDLRGVMNQFADERPVWVTEFGWTTENQAEGYEYGAEVSEEDQANYLTGAFDVAREQMPWVTGMFVWNLNFSTIVPPEDEKYPWSVLNDNWSPRPAYEALQQMPKP